MRVTYVKPESRFVWRKDWRKEKNNLWHEGRIIGYIVWGPKCNGKVAGWFGSERVYHGECPFEAMLNVDAMARKNYS